MPTVERLRGREILDSRGRPTVLATCRLTDGTQASASVPSGASTGAAEAIELRDGVSNRYAGKGCRKAADNVSRIMHDAVTGKEFESQLELDQYLCELDGTPNKSRLGANAILAVSIAFARASAMQDGVPLYTRFAQIMGREPEHLPRLTINLFSGGKHAGAQVAIQDVLLVPSSQQSFDESLSATYNVYQEAAEIAWKKYGMRLLTADEGGLAPPFENTHVMLELACRAIAQAGYEPVKDFCLAVDVASSHFHSEGLYSLDGRKIDAGAMIDQLDEWTNEFPIVSVEDGLAEDDWENWPLLNERLGEKVLVLGDDLLCTNPDRIIRARDNAACNALLLKVNQIGTLSEAAEAYRLAKRAGWNVTISVRSGETEDNWAADLSVGWSGDQFKNGSITQSERLAKYNRLLEIEQEVKLPMCSWPGAVRR